MSSNQDEMGLDSSTPGMTIPYSVSIPQNLSYCHIANLVGAAVQGVPVGGVGSPGVQH